MFTMSATAVAAEPGAVASRASYALKEQPCAAAAKGAALHSSSYRCGNAMRQVQHCVAAVTGAGMPWDRCSTAKQLLQVRGCHRTGSALAAAATGAGMPWDRCSTG